MLTLECSRHLVKICILWDEEKIVLMLHRQREHSPDKGMVIVNVRENVRRNSNGLIEQSSGYRLNILIFIHITAFEKEINHERLFQ